MSEDALILTPDPGWRARPGAHGAGTGRARRGVLIATEAMEAHLDRRLRTVRATAHL